MPDRSLWQTLPHQHGGRLALRTRCPVHIEPCVFDLPHDTSYGQESELAPSGSGADGHREVKGRTGGNRPSLSGAFSERIAQRIIHCGSNRFTNTSSFVNKRPRRIAAFSPWLTRYH
jgi:hypothetical protein